MFKKLHLPTLTAARIRANVKRKRLPQQKVS